MKLLKLDIFGKLNEMSVNERCCCVIEESRTCYS